MILKFSAIVQRAIDWIGVSGGVAAIIFRDIEGEDGGLPSARHRSDVDPIDRPAP
jgi:hypothetical protein